MSRTSNKPLSWYREVYIKDLYRCVYCGRDMISDFDAWMSIEVDHVVPQSKGGGDDLENRVTSCNVCNRFKGRYLPDNYSEMETAEILTQARQYVLDKRAEWQAMYIPAIEEFHEASNGGGES